MNRISKKDVMAALSVLADEARLAKLRSDHLEQDGCNIEYGRYLAFNQAITLITLILL